MLVYLKSTMEIVAITTKWISSVVQTFRSSGRQNPMKDADNELSILLSRQFRAFRNDDPKEKQQKALFIRSPR